MSAAAGQKAPEACRCGWGLGALQEQVFIGHGGMQALTVVTAQVVSHLAKHGEMRLAFTIGTQAGDARVGFACAAMHMGPGGVAAVTRRLCALCKEVGGVRLIVGLAAEEEETGRRLVVLDRFENGAVDWLDVDLGPVMERNYDALIDPRNAFPTAGQRLGGRMTGNVFEVAEAVFH